MNFWDAIFINPNLVLIIQLLVKSHSDMALNSNISEKTEVLYGNDNIVKKTLDTFSWIRETLDGCIDNTEVAMHVT